MVSDIIANTKTTTVTIITSCDDVVAREMSNYSSSIIRMFQAI